MNKQEYNEHLTKFHADTFKDYIIKMETTNGGYSNSSSPQSFITHAFKEYTEVYNKTLAQPFLDTIKMNIENLPAMGKYNVMYNDFPEMYWQTLDGKNYRKEIFRSIVMEESRELTSSINLGINIELDTIKNSINNIKNFYQTAIKDSRNESIDVYTNITNYLEQIIYNAECITKSKEENSKLGSFNIQDISKAMTEIATTSEKEDSDKIFNKILYGYISNIERKFDLNLDKSVKNKIK